MMEVGGRLMFLADDGATGQELWTSDGTLAGTHLVKEIAPGFDSAWIQEPVLLNGALYFSATTAGEGAELWTSDGTAAGTKLVKDISPGTSSSNPYNLVVAGNTLFFNAQSQLWSTDGTPAGTMQLTSYGMGVYAPSYLTNVDGVLAFSVYSWNDGTELWKSDGTVAGTVRVKDIRPGSSGSNPSSLFNASGVLYFTAYDDAGDRRLWKSDLTEAGTVLVKDLNPDGQSSYPGQFTEANGLLFFVHADQSGDRELWRTDGTDEGTFRVKDIEPTRSSEPDQLTNVNGLLVFTANDVAGGRELWTSDGTTAGTTRLLDIRPGSVSSYPDNFAVRGSKLYFAAYNGNYRELYVTDGTAAGTQIVKPYSSGGPYEVSRLTNTSLGLFFAGYGNSAAGYEPWLSDGTASGTSLLKNIELTTAGSSYFGSAVDLNGALYFSYSNLMKTDGTAGGTVSITPAAPMYSVDRITKAGNRLYFLAYDNTTGQELWTSDGTDAGTFRLSTITPGSDYPYVSSMIDVDGVLYFLARPVQGTAQLWKSDGTVAGTVLVKSISDPNYSVGELAAANGKVFFRAEDASLGYELYVSDGTAAGTTLLKDLRTGSGSSYPALFATVGDSLFFTATDDNGFQGLWKTDGTAAGTVVVRAAGQGAPQWPSSLVNANGTLYFSAYAYGGNTGQELWKSDGTAAGTILVKDIFPSYRGSYPRLMTDVNGTVFFVARGSESTGDELWKTDGTPEGTLLVKDILPGSRSSDIQWLTNVGGTLYFTANNGSSGRELWMSDGTAAGTVMVAEIEPQGASDPSLLTVSGHRLFFQANTLANGRELWSLTFEDRPNTLTLTAGAVLENGPAGVLVGTLAATDPDSAGPFTFELVAGPGDGSNASFSVVGNQLFTTGPLNAEPLSGTTIRVRVTDSSGLWYERRFTISISDVNESEISEVTDVDAANNRVSEAAGVGDYVGVTASAVDADATTNVVTYSLDDDAGGRFAIDSTTGVVTVLNPALLDRETFAASYVIIVRATSLDNSTSTAEFTIQVDDVNEFPLSQISDSDSIVNEILENSSYGTSLGITALATDGDATSNQVTYSLSGSALYYFHIDPSTGEIKTGSTYWWYDPGIDRESLGGSFGIDVYAYSADGSYQVTTFTVAILDVDEYDVDDVYDLDYEDYNAGRVDENAPAGSYVGITAYAYDSDATNNTITYSLDDDAGGAFVIDSMTGQVTVAADAHLDYESQRYYSIHVVATSSDESSASTWMYVSLNDVDEYDVETPADLDDTLNSVREDAGFWSYTGLTAHATDGDASSDITYELTDDADGLFFIDSYGYVYVAEGATFDFESTSQYTVTVTATSSDGSSSSQSFTIAIADVDEFNVGPLSDLDDAIESVDENAPTGTPVGITAFAQDLDGSMSGVSYSILDSDSPFQIDAASGVVTVLDGSLLNFEHGASVNVTVRAESEDGSFTDRLFTIAIADVNEHDVTAPVDLDGEEGATVAEDLAVGTAVGITAFASDDDGTNNTVTYSLSANPGGFFAIDSTTGVVTLAAPLNYEAAGGASHTITVQAQSTDGSTSTQDFTITVTDVDEYDISPIVDVDAAADAVAENSPTGAVVGVTAAASDGDGSNSAVTYELTNDAGGRFAIDPVTGVVTVANGTLLDFEVGGSHVIEVRATSADGSTSLRSFTISVTNVNEGQQLVPTTMSVAENLPRGSLVGEFSVTDSNGLPKTYTLVRGQGDNSKFTLTGNQLRTRSPFNYEGRSTYTVVVQVRDASGFVQTRSVRVNVTDVNERPNGLGITSVRVAENQPVGTVVGRFIPRDVDRTDSFTYAFVDGEATSNGQFTIVGGELRTAAAFDYEARKSYLVRVRMTDQGGLSVETVFTIQVTNVKEAPTAIQLSNARVKEHQRVGTVIGRFTASDPDENSRFNYTLVAGEGDTDNARFRIVNDQLRSAAIFDFEVQSSYRIRVRVTDRDGLSYETTFVISVMPA
jgi:ELWxxDGT repeat protein